MQYHLVMVNHSLHHFVALELLFDTIHKVLHPEGYFVADDMIGRNGHMRWPEALAILEELWAELPDRYKYNHQLRRLEIEYENWDCSRQGGNEGIRSQDILPLLLKKFHFDLFVGFANVIDVFVDRNFGHNFDPNDAQDNQDEKLPRRKRGPRVRFLRSQPDGPPPGSAGVPPASIPRRPGCRPSRRVSPRSGRKEIHGVVPA